VKISVGGQLFETRRDTVTTGEAKGSLLAELFSGRHRIHPQADSEDTTGLLADEATEVKTGDVNTSTTDIDSNAIVRFDRNPAAFGCLLEYLRSPSDFDRPTDKAILKQLKKDVKYFMMSEKFTGLVKGMKNGQWQPGVAVFALWRRKDKVLAGPYPATIVKRNTNGTYHVKFDDGDSQEDVDPTDISDSVTCTTLLNRKQNLNLTCYANKSRP
jgi:hypothetical protein